MKSRQLWVASGSYAMVFVVSLVAGCGAGSDDSCTAPVACATDASMSYRLCGAGASDCYYKTADGQRLHCVTCGDCSAAQTKAEQYCGGSSSVSLVCGATVNCPAGAKSYQACATPSGTACGFKTSDGTEFSCASCSDCTAAATQTTSWCRGSSPKGSCDPVAQDCGAKKKCEVGLDGDSALVTHCVNAEVSPYDGQFPLGDSCTVTDDPTYHVDNCQAGLICDRYNCQKLCKQDADCGGQKCVDTVGGSGVFGACATTCTPFLAHACASGTDCGGSNYAVGPNAGNDGYFFCKPTGNSPTFGTCDNDASCAAGLSCTWSAKESALICVPNCNASHPCPSGTPTLTCTPYSNQGGAGYCMPE